MEKDQVLVNEYQAAKILGLQVQTLRNWRCQLRGPAYVKLGKAVRYKIQDLERYINDNRVAPKMEG